MEFPRLWLELIIALSIFISIIFLLNANYNLSEILASIGIYAAVGFRSLSSINRLVVAYQGLAYSKSVVDIIYEELKLDLVKNNHEKNKKLQFQKTLKFQVFLLNTMVIKYLIILIRYKKSISWYYRTKWFRKNNLN